MSKSGMPKHIDAPSATFFPVGKPAEERPFNGDNKLRIILQDYVSVNGSYPGYGATHPTKNSARLFHRTPEQNLGGGLTRSTCMFAHIGGEIKQKIRQSVNFYGVRHREVKYTETFKRVIRVPTMTKLSGTSSSTVRVAREIIKTKEVNDTRELTAYNIVAREPFSEECICTLHTRFYNLAYQTPNVTKKRLLVRDSNKASWTTQIKSQYESDKHEKSVKHSTPSAPSLFTSGVGTNYLSETSTPSANWYAGKLGTDDYIVQPTNLEPYYGGKLVKLDWITTEYR